jgi:hypothetical protein
MRGGKIKQQKRDPVSKHDTIDSWFIACAIHILRVGHIDGTSFAELLRLAISNHNCTAGTRSVISRRTLYEPGQQGYANHSSC